MIVNPNDPRQPYEQIAAHLRDAINAGEFKPGEKLASGRRLADEYAVALNTVQRALEALQREGLLVTSRRGTFVRSATSEPGEAPSPEYVAIMERLDAIQDDLRQIDNRVSELEDLTKPSGPQQPQ